MATRSRVIDDMSTCTVCKREGQLRLDLRSTAAYCGTHYIMIKAAESRMKSDLEVYAATK